MSHSKTSYYKEGLSYSFDENGITATPEQIKAIAEDIAVYVENECMAFYRPGWGEQASSIEDEWKKRYAALQAEFDEYRRSAELAVKRALKQHSDAVVQIGKNGEVHRYDGRTTQIQ
ncbi:hypothetical protein [Azorhizophilus paspali]|uniref:hypothetical protein n=1 Tax=Azorhizophilus paspali TaxID=69963 RepID=UPI003642D623